MKLKPIKPIQVRYQWQNEFRLVKMAIYIVLACICVTVYVAYINSEAKIEEQDRIIQKQYDLIVSIVNLQLDTIKRLENVTETLKRVEEGHTKHETKHGPIYQHGPLEE